MPDAEPYRAWAGFSFTAVSGRVCECDLLVCAPRGLFLVELKSLGGTVTNNGDSWMFHRGKRARTMLNPLHLVDLKCKELKGLLARAAGQLRLGIRVPRIEPAVFLSAADLQVELDDAQRPLVYGRDDLRTGLPWIWRDLLGQEAATADAGISEHLPVLLRHIGIRAASAHLRFGEDWALAPRPLDIGPTWEDRLATRVGEFPEEGRLRIYLSALQATAEARASVERQAAREYRILRGITHSGIAQPRQYGRHGDNPAILFHHRASDLRLDDFLAVHGTGLTAAHRRDMVRQLADALRYAHSHSLYHRALSPRSVTVSPREDGSAPDVRIADWHSASRTGTATFLSSIAYTALDDTQVAEVAAPYLAPEFDVPGADPVALDMFGLGALTHLLLAGEPPAQRRTALLQRLAAEGGLRIPGPLGDAVFQATHRDPSARPLSIEAVIAELDQVERDTCKHAVVIVDPLAAMPGQWIAGGWVVERVLGTGATARVIEVDGDGGRRVLKVALDEGKAELLRVEARALHAVGGGAVVRLLDGPRLMSGRTALHLTHAGEETLACQLRRDGGCCTADLDRFGRDLFTALDQLSAAGVRHRDIKPDNLGILPRADGSRRLVLFDFSLAGRPSRDTRSGTYGYLDPFLGTEARPVYDDAAERYAAAVTLHEMAAGQLPTWGDGLADPRMTNADLPAIATDLFDPALRSGLTGFFERALHRDVGERFTDLADMDQAWRTLFPRHRASDRRPARRLATLTAVASVTAAVALLLSADRSITISGSPAPATTPATTSTMPSTRTPVPSPPFALATSITVDLPPGEFSTFERSVQGALQTVTIRQVSTGKRIAVVHAFPPGGYDPTEAEKGQSLTSSGRAAYVATLPGPYDGATDDRMPSVAVRNGDDHWFLAQVVEAVPAAADLARRIADGTRFDTPHPLRYPVRFGYLPADLHPCAGADNVSATGAPNGMRSWDSAIELCDNTSGTRSAASLSMRSKNGSDAAMAWDLRIQGHPAQIDVMQDGQVDLMVDCGDYVLDVVLPSGYSRAEAERIAQGVQTRRFADKASWFDGPTAVPHT
ncbi:protein kinase domain-containing protein [Actinokineospora diospyrosa]|nr:NERD domain-containing protein [Actinokineospora diospyrosa]